MTDQNSLPPLEFSRPVAAEKLGAAEKIFNITAEPAECQALAERFAILAVDALSATVRLKSIAGGKRVRLRGHFEADVVQACVVTLEPVTSHLAEDFELIYAVDPEKRPDGGELVFDPTEEDPPEPMENGVIDIGEAAAEHLALALDPFPRLPGASFESPEEPADEPVAAPNPFAVLSGLQKK